MRLLLVRALFVILSAVAVGCGDSSFRQQDLPLEPFSLGGLDLDQGWVREGCGKGFIDASYIGPESGFICTWRRKEGALTRLRQEGFRLDGERIFVKEKILRGRLIVGKVKIYGQGSRFYRVVQVYKTQSVVRAEALVRDHSQLEIIDDGRIVCVYKSDREVAMHQGRIWNVPGDAALIKGMPCREVEARLKEGQPAL